jgi:IS30 family transposase
LALAWRSRITIRSYAKRISRQTWAAVEQELRVRHSPEQISAVLACDSGVRVSHESIYRHVWKDKRAGGDRWTCLRGRLRRGRRYRVNRQRGQIVGRVYFLRGWGRRFLNPHS